MLFVKGSKFRKWSPDEVWEDSHLILFFWASLQYWDFLLLSNFDKNIEEKCYKLRWPKTKIQFPLILESSVSEQEEADQLMRMCLTGLDTLMIQSHFRSTRGRSSSGWAGCWRGERGAPASSSWFPAWMCMRRLTSEPPHTRSRRRR